jgi:transposase-like protein
MANKKKKAKRYTAAEKKEILGFIDSQGRGGQTKAVAKYGVTAATIASWRKKSGASPVSSGRGGGSSKELKAVEELASLIKKISATEAQLTKLKAAYKKAKAKL